MAKTVTIPAGDNPFVCKINDVYYSYPAGTTVEVPDEVAALIQANAGNREKSNGLSDIAIPRDGEVNDVLTRTADGAKWATPAAPEPELPSVSGSDNGKVLKVVEGAWAAASGGGSSDVIIMRYDENTSKYDKTWLEVYTAISAGKMVVVSDSITGEGYAGASFSIIASVSYDEEGTKKYVATAIAAYATGNNPQAGTVAADVYIADTANDYLHSDLI